jgi:hypothetical protein
LLGSGLSSPYLATLGNIETLLAELDMTVLTDSQRKIIACSLYKSYFDGVIEKNPSILRSDPKSVEVLDAYSEFLKTINSLLLRRKSTILSKEVNIFTTNVDIFLEKALEDVGLEYNDGFNGRFRPSFSLSNFKKSHFKRSLHYDNTSELPVFNLLKLHGSLTWEMTSNSSIVFSRDLQHVTDIGKRALPKASIVEVKPDSTLESLRASCADKVDPALDPFLESYNKLLIVNPTKEKFKHSLLNQTYYELLRIYSNELEKENTVLFVMGFSFADEHIREITLRVANSNPTLIVYVVAHSSRSKKLIEGRFGVNRVKNRNIEIIAPPVDDKVADKLAYDLPRISREIFGNLLEPDGSTNPGAEKVEGEPS